MKSENVFSKMLLGTIAIALLIASVAAQAAPFKGEVPTSEELYLRGKFTPAKKDIWDENHTGEALDLSLRRPVVKLDGSIFAQKYAKPDTTLIANVYHNSRFYIARVPNDGVKRAFFILAYFPPIVPILNKYIAAHSLLRFEMQKPIELVAEVPSEAKLDSMSRMSPAQAYAELPAEIEGLELRNVAISAEAQWSKNDPKKAYDLKRGALGAFVQIVRVVSMEERFKEFYQSGNPSTQIEIEGVADLDGALAEGIRKSESEGTAHLYHTLVYNCTTLAFDIIEKGLNLVDNRFGVIRKFAQKGIPIRAPMKLAHYGSKPAMPVEMDPSLAQESVNAYQEVVIEKRTDINSPALSRENRRNIQNGIQTWTQRNARPQASVAPMCSGVFGA